MHVIPDLSYKRGLKSGLADCREHIYRSASGILLEELHPGISASGRGKVYQEFTKSHNIIFLFHVGSSL